MKFLSASVALDAVAEDVGAFIGVGFFHWRLGIGVLGQLVELLGGLRADLLSSNYRHGFQRLARLLGLKFAAPYIWSSHRRFCDYLILF